MQPHIVRAAARRERPRGPPLRAAGGPAGDLAGDRGDADGHPDRRWWPRARATGRMVQGYPVAGKTGTAQKADPVTRRLFPQARRAVVRRLRARRAPRLAILAMLDEPKTVVWGSEAGRPDLRGGGGAGPAPPRRGAGRPRPRSRSCAGRTGPSAEPPRPPSRRPVSRHCRSRHRRAGDAGPRRDAASARRSPSWRATSSTWPSPDRGVVARRRQSPAPGTPLSPGMAGLPAEAARRQRRPAS